MNQTQAHDQQKADTRSWDHRIPQPTITCQKRLLWQRFFKMSLIFYSTKVEPHFSYELLRLHASKAVSTETDCQRNSSWQTLWLICHTRRASCSRTTALAGAQRIWRWYRHDSLTHSHTPTFGLSWQQLSRLDFHVFGSLKGLTISNLQFTEAEALTPSRKGKTLFYYWSA